MARLSRPTQRKKPSTTANTPRVSSLSRMIPASRSTRCKVRPECARPALPPTKSTLPKTLPTLMTKRIMRGCCASWRVFPTNFALRASSADCGRTQRPHVGDISRQSRGNHPAPAARGERLWLRSAVFLSSDQQDLCRDQRRRKGAVQPPRSGVPAISRLGRSPAGATSSQGPVTKVTKNPGKPSVNLIIQGVSCRTSGSCEIPWRPESESPQGV